MHIANDNAKIFKTKLQQIADIWRQRACIAARRDAMEDHEAARVEAAKSTVWVTGCTSWYLDDRGIPAVWPWTFDRFREEMAAPELDHYERIT